MGRAGGWLIDAPDIAGPSLDVGRAPDGGCGEPCQRLGEVLAVRQLIDALTADAEQFGDLGRSHQLIIHRRTLSLTSLRASVGDSKEP